ncbi:BQ5605_C019g08827 [Microbotryum silenes-dioicae]|uniref:BQ5605_C019g08827 protein n=1 Tax=Microbotryum silenes-dioicae TaxID=796604 RepID=A0A2X0LVS6_9BASI|nr:BQ5605_C019g08827 [Microbotryum silenes-dioicae]
MIEGCTGSAAALRGIWHADEPILHITEARALGTQQTVYSTELDGIALVMRTLFNAQASTFPRRIVICVDNQAAVRVAISTRPGPGQE